MGVDAALDSPCFADSPPIAAEVARGVTRLLCRQDLFSICEVPLPNGRRADMMAIDSRGGPDAATVVMTRPRNADGILRIRGLEVGWVQPLDKWLPWRGFGFSETLTLIDQKATGEGTQGFVALGVTLIVAFLYAAMGQGVEHGGDVPPYADLRVGKSIVLAGIDLAFEVAAKALDIFGRWLDRDLVLMYGPEDEIKKNPVASRLKAVREDRGVDHESSLSAHVVAAPEHGAGERAVSLRRQRHQNAPRQLSVKVRPRPE